jgi:hypothetical protein
MVRWLGILVGTLRGSVRTRRELALENLALRQQLAVWKARQPRPPLRATDRIFWVVLSRLWTNWRHSLQVRPETVVGWHRQGFRRYWAPIRSGARPGSTVSCGSAPGGVLEGRCLRSGRLRQGTGGPPGRRPSRAHVLMLTTLSGYLRVPTWARAGGGIRGSRRRSPCGAFRAQSVPCQSSQCGESTNPFFLPSGVKAFKHDAPNAEVKLFDQVAKHVGRRGTSVEQQRRRRVGPPRLGRRSSAHPH